MTDFISLSAGYPWIVAGHLIAMVCWFAGLFYLPRLFIYHRAATDTVSRERFVVMESRLYRTIMNPAMIATLGFGFWALAETWRIYGTAAWLWAKVVLVVLLIGHHHYCRGIMRKLAAGDQVPEDRFLRLFNEVPTVVLIVVVVLAVVKPF